MTLEEWVALANTQNARDILRDKRRADRFLPLVEEILGPVRLATREEDCKGVDCFDWLHRGITLRFQESPKAFARPWDFTMRYAKDSGVLVEYHRAFEGVGDQTLYAHVHPTLYAFRLWTLIDLNVWRRHMLDFNTPWPGGRVIDLHDGTYMIAFDMRTFPPEMIIRQGGL